MTRREAFRIFRGEFLRSVGLLVSVPLTVAIVGLTTGRIEKNLIEIFGPGVWLVIILAAGFWATHKAALRVTTDYENSYSVRRAEAYRVFYQLLREGEHHMRAISMGAKQRTEWDLKVQSSLAKYCISERLGVYLKNTGDREESDSPLESEYLAYAMGFLRELLDRDFSWGRPLIK
jgi:hypothetical protein